MDVPIPIEIVVDKMHRLAREKAELEMIVDMQNAQIESQKRRIAMLEGQLEAHQAENVVSLQGDGPGDDPPVG